ncbi:TPR repeat-containing protein DDB_G0287407-like [Pomacea canaliculata]|uniref:TPR repeat-containing protein DDB_G0287407-like n=1 Tax=Pomacea canaliculata TaxID=400727 RepID=UPI000D73B072|nr:TPR repeat-containing protein DDB_G0287407-like [Pomacea canaliculata]
MVQLTDLDEFASQVTEFFKKAIATAYPQEERSNQLTPEEKETELQWLYIEDKAETLIGRDRELRMLLDYAQQTPELNLEQIDGSDNPSIRETSQWDLEENDNQLCFVVAEGGWGKTALLARLVHQACEDGHNVFYHFVGSTASSRSHDNLLQRLIMALAEDPADRRLSDPEATTDTLKGHLRTVLSSCRHKGKKMLLVFDGLNELDNNETVQHLSWLPPALPPNLRCVVSANMAHSPTIARLHEHPAVQVTLGALDRGALMELASNYLERFGKKLDLTQLQTLVDISKVNNPQWMMWMCEELRIFGDFRMMDKKLSEMPDTMEDFLQLLLKRLLYEDDTGCIKKTLCLTACSQRGLPSDHILQILGEINDKRECPQLHWAQARRILKPYIRTIQDSTHAEEFITFNHETMWKAVRRSFLEQEETTQWHKQLADFYEFWCKKEELRTNDLPFHLLKAGLRKRLVQFLRTDPDSAQIPAYQRSNFLNEIRCFGFSDTHMAGTKEIRLCHLCSLKSGSFHPGMRLPNKHCCLLCGGMCMQSESAARLCNFHALRENPAPFVFACHLCKMHIFQNQTGPLAGTPALLCHFCSLGMKRCCAIENSDD